MNNLGSKHSVVMKFGQFMLNYKKKKKEKKEKLYEKGGLESSPMSILIFKESIKRNLRIPACSFELI